VVWRIRLKYRDLERKPVLNSDDGMCIMIQWYLLVSSMLANCGNKFTIGTVGTTGTEHHGA